MRIALCFYGQARFLSNPLSSQGIYQHIISNYDTDIFGHTWGSGTYYASSWANLQPIKASNVETKIRSQYPGISLKIEAPITWKPDTDLNNLYSHYYSIEQVGKLIPNPEEYDFIILTRFDVDLTKLAPLDVLPEGFYVMKHHSNSEPHPCQIPDQLIVFSPKYIKFTELYSNIDTITRESFYGAELPKLRHFKNLFPGEPLQKHPINLELIRSTNQ